MSCDSEDTQYPDYPTHRTDFSHTATHTATHKPIRDHSFPINLLLLVPPSITAIKSIAYVIMMISDTTPSTRRHTHTSVNALNGSIYGGYGRGVNCDINMISDPKCQSPLHSISFPCYIISLCMPCQLLGALDCM